MDNVAATFLAVRVCLLSLSEVGGAAALGSDRQNLSRRSLLLAEQLPLGEKTSAKLSPTKLVVQMCEFVVA
jgi:hypothetical protein